MRMLIAACVVFSTALSPQSARAGVYNLAEPPLGPAGATPRIQALPYPQFKGQLTDLLNARFPIETAIRKKYEERRRELDAKLRTGKTSVEEEISLSAYLLYLGEPARAVEVLTPLAGRERNNYLVNTNLMTAHQLVGELDRAAGLILTLRSTTPRIPGATQEQTAWYARVDSFQHKLINERYRESLRSRDGRPKTPETVDDLFGVQFVGPSGKYEAGQLAPDQKAKLPADAVAIVQQLLIWMPDDTRLYWLLGELYNAQGDIRQAAAIFDDCRRESTRRLDAAELREHRQIVHEAVAKLPPPDPTSDGLAEVIGATDSSNSTDEWLPAGGKLAAVGSIAVLLIAVFVYFQIREWRRG